MRSDPADFITATFPLSRAAEAFQAINSGREVKILVLGEANGHATGALHAQGGRP